MNLEAINGRQVKSVEADFSALSENWCEYQVDGGGTVRVRATAVRIFRVVYADTEEPALDPMGIPIFHVDHQLQLTARS